MSCWRFAAGVPFIAMYRTYTPLEITEPMTMLTDYVITAQCAAYAASLAKKTPQASRGSAKWWTAAFGATALAALAGGSAHGFRAHLGDDLGPLAFRITNSLVASSALATAVAVFRSLRKPRAPQGPPRQEGHRWLLRGGIATGAGLALLAGFNALKWAPHEHFDQNVIYHLIQSAGLHSFYRGALALDGLGGTPAKAGGAG